MFEQLVFVYVEHSNAYHLPQATSEVPVVSRTEQRAYAAGSTVSFDGAVSRDTVGDLREVVVEIIDSTNKSLLRKDVQVGSDSKFGSEMRLPESAGRGEYKLCVKPKEGLFGRIIPGGPDSYCSPSVFVEQRRSFPILANGESFSVDIISNSQVSGVQFSGEQRRLALTVEGSTGTTGIVNIELSKRMLGGEYIIQIDGQPVTDSNRTIIKDKGDNVMVEVNYTHSVHTIEILGATAIPEYPSSVVIFAIAITAVIALLTLRSGALATFSKRRGMQ
jgi:hypothetical protein